MLLWLLVPVLLYLLIYCILLKRNDPDEFDDTKTYYKKFFYFFFCCKCGRTDGGVRVGGGNRPNPPPPPIQQFQPDEQISLNPLYQSNNINNYNNSRINQNSLIDNIQQGDAFNLNSYDYNRGNNPTENFVDWMDREINKDYELRGIMTIEADDIYNKNKLDSDCKLPAVS